MPSGIEWMMTCAPRKSSTLSEGCLGGSRGFLRMVFGTTGFANALNLMYGKQRRNVIFFLWENAEAGWKQNTTLNQLVEQICRFDRIHVMFAGFSQKFQIIHRDFDIELTSTWGWHQGRIWNCIGKEEKREASQSQWNTNIVQRHLHAQPIELN